MNRLLVLVIVFVAFTAAAFKSQQFNVATGFKTAPQNVSGKSDIRFQSHFASTRQHIQTHAASAIELKDGRVRAFWFSGSSEGAKDVEIHSAVFDPTHGLWGREQSIVNREDTEHSLMRYVSKLGNPVAARGEDGALWLYFVTVSMGGWAGSSITLTTSFDEGETWSPPRRLITSPFMNISTLIKGAPFLYGDGTIGLPVYHEFISKFGEILHFDKAGILIGKQRLSAGNDHALQPVLLPCNANEALILMRHSGDDHRNVVSVFTRDGGQHWTKPEKSTLFNPDAALSAITLADGRILAVLNNQVQKRDALTLVLSGDGGKSWKNVYLLEDQRGKPVDVANYQITVAGLAKEIIGATNDAFVKSAQSAMCSASECRFEFSYPYLIQTRKGDFHLVYTWNRSFIKHLWFSQAWLDQQSKETGHD